MAVQIITIEDLNEFRSLLLNDIKEIIQSKPHCQKSPDTNNLPPYHQWHNRTKGKGKDATGHGSPFHPFIDSRGIHHPITPPNNATNEQIEANRQGNKETAYKRLQIEKQIPYK